jgi:hypothetical protein
LDANNTLTGSRGGLGASNPLRTNRQTLREWVAVHFAAFSGWILRKTGFKNAPRYRHPTTRSPVRVADRAHPVPCARTVSSSQGAEVFANGSKRGAFRPNSVIKSALRICMVCAALFGAACSFSNAKIVTVWTDQSVVALYADYFNSAQDKYKAEVFYFENVCDYLAETRPQGNESPDIVIGNWLNSADALSLFRPIEPYYQNAASIETLFYPGLLEAGRLKNAQVLLPVSFDLYVLAFDQNNIPLLPDPFSISINDIQTISADYNHMQSGTWTRIGFSPLWNEEFLFLMTELLGVQWQEAAPGVAATGAAAPRTTATLPQTASAEPVSWDNATLETTLESLREWVIVANDSVEADDDFYFKYFYEPPDKLAADDRILFTFTRVSDFFKLAKERRDAIDFRWLEHENRIIPIEEIVYYGVYRNADSKSAASAFTDWFFNEGTQRNLLARGKTTRSAEHYFGIANGFSTMRAVTETIFPQYYTGMLGHIPPEEKLVSPGVFPPFFPEIKERVILPYLREKIRQNNSPNTRPLELRFSDWVRTG